MKKQNIPKGYTFQGYKENDLYIDYYYKDYLGKEHIYREYKIEEINEIQKIIRDINTIRGKFIEKWGLIPDIIIVNNEIYHLLNREFSYCGELKSIFGMKIIIDDSIIDSADIKVHYSIKEIIK